MNHLIVQMLVETLREKQVETGILKHICWIYLLNAAPYNNSFIALNFKGSQSHTMPHCTSLQTTKKVSNRQVAKRTI